MMSPSRFLSVSLVVIFVFILITNNLYCTINYTKQLQDDIRYIYRSTLKNAQSVARDNVDKKIETGVTGVDRLKDEPPAIPYLKRAKNPKWFEVVAREFKDEMINIGLVNVDASIDGVQTRANMVRVRFDRAGEGIRWSDLSPERVYENSTCPKIPMPKFENYRDLDVVVARVPRSTGYRVDGMRDVFGLQVNLVVANLVVKSGRKGNGVVLAVFVDSGNPIRDIFRCDDLLWNEGRTWIYKPEMTRMKKMVVMPIGPCQFVPQLSDFDDIVDEDLQRPQREAYVTVLHTSEDYVCGAIVLAQSIIQTNSTKDLVLLADDNISAASIAALRLAGWKTHRIERIRSPYSKKGSYNEWNYSKLRIWQLKQYDKVMFIDADLVVVESLDGFFAYPQMSAVGNYQKHLFNSGVMVVEPSQCAYEALVEKMEVVESYNGGDQGFLNEMFVWWHRLPHEANFMKVFVEGRDRHEIEEGVRAVHYTGLKPWKCAEEEHDCNWDLPIFRRYASDDGHKIWWRVFRAMPERLRPFCSKNRETARIPLSSNAGLRFESSLPPSPS